MDHAAVQKKLSASQRLAKWFDRNFMELGRELRLSFLPPLMIYVAAGISGLTGIVGTFFVKDYLGLSAEFLAGLAFWTMLPWTLKLPLGHLVDLVWRYKGILVFVGAGLIAASLLIMIGLLSNRTGMELILPAGTWYVMSAVLAPIGYVIQDVVADAMTVEAVPKINDLGMEIPEEQERLMHSTMQTLGRVATIAGTLLVALVNVYLFHGAEGLPEPEKVAIYKQIYELALIIPVVSVIGVLVAMKIRQNHRISLQNLGFTSDQIETMTQTQTERPKTNWWILGGGLTFAAVSVLLGLSQLHFGQEIIFAVSMFIVTGLMFKLTDEMEPQPRSVLLGTAILIFMFRAVPGPGPGSSWWMIDELHFDQSFMAKLSLIGSILSLGGLFLFRRFMAEKSMIQIVILLTLASTILSLPTIGMYYGLHHWTAALTGGIVDARFIALIDTALESPLGQVSMVPMLAWIAHSAPTHLKATFFAVLASFTNLSLAFSQLGTKYLNQIYHVTREVRDAATGAITVTADYSHLGQLLIISTLLGLLLPLGSVALIRAFGWRSA